MRPTAIVGDIHGDAGRLLPALRALLPDGRRLVFVGDYINRGRRSREVLDILADLREDSPEDMILLRGNHEAALLRWLKDGDHRSFLQHGGLLTVQGYLTDDAGGRLMDRFPAAFPQRHRELLDSTLPYFEERDLFVSHAGFDPSQPSSRDWATMTMGTRGTMFAQPGRRPQRTTIFGHYVQRSREPYDQDGLVCLDTGCGSLPDGPLTVMLLPEYEFTQF
jgi:serine/threonine protein phosphatase 1